MKRLVAGCIIALLGAIGFVGIILALNEGDTSGAVGGLVMASAMMVGGGFLIHFGIQSIRHSIPTDGGGIRRPSDSNTPQWGSMVFGVILGVMLTLLYIGYDWELPSSRENYNYDLYSMGPDGVEGGGDDITNRTEE